LRNCDAPLGPTQRALVDFKEAGFAASPAVQRARSPRGLPHCVEPRFHCRRRSARLTSQPTRNLVMPQVHRSNGEHHLQLSFLSPYSPELNFIEIVWKQATYHWLSFVSMTKQTIDDEVGNLLGSYGYPIQNQLHLNTCMTY
jgi:hypothetical protein